MFFFLLANVLSALRFTVSDYTFGIFKLFYYYVFFFIKSRKWYNKPCLPISETLALPGSYKSRSYSFCTLTYRWIWVSDWPLQMSRRLLFNSKNCLWWYSTL